MHLLMLPQFTLLLELLITDGTGIGRFVNLHVCLQVLWTREGLVTLETSPVFFFLMVLQMFVEVFQDRIALLTIGAIVP